MARLTSMLSVIGGCAAAAIEPDAGSHWAVLVAGSKTYSNYRHQSDICHAYQIMVANGIPKDQIITFAYDDIASYSYNPFPGKIFNKPTANGVPGVDVYAGCNIDYSGSSVTKANFAAVLTGDASGTNGGNGKVLKSTSKDRVFINFVDHGGVHLVAFPSETLHASELIDTLTTMNTKSMYSELVFYLEACEAGSMFDGLLPENTKIYATTASNGGESSWGTYCMPDDEVDGEHVGSCLGDLYSVSWMEDMDARVGSSETLAEQFITVKALTDMSHVMEYGETSFKSEQVTAFAGATDAFAASKKLKGSWKPNHSLSKTSLPSTDAALASAYYRFTQWGDETAGEELLRGVQQRKLAKTRFAEITHYVTGSATTELATYKGAQMTCHHAAHKVFKETCGDWDEQALAYSVVFAQLCQHTLGNAAPIMDAVRATCK